MGYSTSFFVDMCCSKLDQFYAVRGEVLQDGGVRIEVEHDLEFVRLIPKSETIEAKWIDTGGYRCPHCSAASIIKCSSCSRLACAGFAALNANIEGKQWRCPWCQGKGVIRGRFREFAARRK